MANVQTGYKLRATLSAHSGDVRALCVARTGNDTIISGSRDKTGILWSEEDGKFVSKVCLKGPEKYVSSVGWVPGSSQNPQGFILIGSHDKVVRVYSLSSSDVRQPVWSLIGHTDAISCIAANADGTVLTGSWDCTAKLWMDSMCMASLKGHEMAVWAVEYVSGAEEVGDGQLLLATGSADKTVKIWSSAGKLLRTLTGHTDVVRGLVCPGPKLLLSCANDASIRLWDVMAGKCLRTYAGHSNYIYSIALLGQQEFVTSGEDSSVRVWNLNSTDPLHTIRLPAKSIWAVAGLSNGDIVAGGSDSQIRIFTRDSSRTAAPEVQKVYESEVSTQELASKEVLDGIKNEDLPTEAALMAPGTKDGQTKIIRRGTGVEIYNWSATENQWTKIGDVVGSTSDKSKAKSIHNGREYDYVFSVDFDESKPPIKLPYNLTDDPWTEAQKFLTDNDLPQGYLETVAKFIMTNAPGAGLASAAAIAQSGYQDPFTGGGRYVPGVGQQAPSAGGADPFTGGGRYVPSSGGQAATQNYGGGADPFTGASSYTTAAAGSPTKPVVNAVYPIKEYLQFGAANVDAILRKLKEHLDSEGVDLPGEAVDQFRPLMQPEPASQTPSFDLLNGIGKILDLPEKKLFPALDVLRLAIRHRAVGEYFCNAERRDFFIQFLLPLIRSSVPANQQLSLKILANLFSSCDTGRQLLMTKRNDLLQAAREASLSVDKNVQIASAALILNYVVLLNGQSNVVSVAEEKLLLLYTVVEVIKTPKTGGGASDDEALYRLLVALGTLLVGGDSTEIKGYAQALDVSMICGAASSGTSDERIKSVCTALSGDLR